MSIQLTVMSLDFDSTAAPFTQVFEKDEITLGRLPGNDLILDKPEISGYHASLRVKDGEEKQIIFIKDLGSSNGTMVENTPLRAQSEIAVEPNQRIIIGNYLIKPSILESKAAPESEEVPERSKVTSITEAVNFSAQTQEVEEVGVVTEKMQANAENIPLPDAASETTKEETPSREDTVTELHTAQEVKDKSEASSAEAGEFDDTCVITVNVDDADLEDINFYAKKRLSLNGIVAHRGVPIEGVVVSDATLGQATTNAEGAFEFKRIIEGSEYSLSFEKDGYSFESLEGVLALAAPAIDVEACKLHSIRGRIMHGDTPLADVAVDGGAILGTTRTDADGYYHFQGVPEGAQYTLRVSKEDFVLATKKA